MKRNLQEGSKSYHSEADNYERFSEAEDYPKKILKFIKPKFKGKVILDVGCGNGLYAKSLSPVSKEYICLDISREQLKKAKRRIANLKKLRFICCSAEMMPISSNSVDIIVSSWAISAMKGFGRKAMALNEFERILKTNGQIYLIENNIGGEFEKIRGRYPNIGRTKKYNDWLKKRGFRPVKRINTYFNFKSLEEAKNTIGSIWGERVGNLVKRRIINHKVIIFTKVKSST